jgi:phage terminase large subunit-like protein
MKELIPWDACVKKQHTIQGGTIHKIDWHNGSSLKLLSYEQMPKKHEGYTWDAVFFDEPPPRFAYIAAYRGTMKTKAPMMFAMTPLSEPWIQEQIVESPATIRVESDEDFAQIKKHSTCMVVVSFPEIEHLTQDEKDAFEATLTEEEKAARIFGQALHLQGRVFKSYSNKRRLLDDEDLERMSTGAGLHWSEWPWGQIVDPHDRRPYASMWFVISPREEMIVVREWPEFDYYSVKNSENKVDDYVKLFEDLEEECFQHPPTWRRMDPRFGRTPKATTNTTLQEEFAVRGLDYDTLFTDDQMLEPGHHKISMMLSEDRLFIHEGCSNMHRAFMNYVRADHPRDDGSRPAREGLHGVKERHKDFIDLVRYALDGDDLCWHDPIQPTKNKYTLPVGGGLGRRH